ncbi:MAG: hypothetical protein IPF59_14035 [Ignavibacteria bacterium]|nr:hypothetical protein [Ignavibacteria bacterium]
MNVRLQPDGRTTQTEAALLDLINAMVADVRLPYVQTGHCCSSAIPSLVRSRVQQQHHRVEQYSSISRGDGAKPRTRGSTG